MAAFDPFAMTSGFTFSAFPVCRGFFAIGKYI